MKFTSPLHVISSGFRVGEPSDDVIMLDATHSNVDVETEFGGVSLIVIFLYIFTSKIIFSFCKFVETAKDC